MTETQKRIKAYKKALPDLRERVIAVALLLAMSASMLTSATFAWVTLSRAPEVSSVTTNIAANGNLEIAIATGDGTTPPGESQVGDSSATDGQSILAANRTWGNLINLSDPSYGLDHLALRPAQLNTAALLTKPLYGAVYDADGRINTLTTNYGYTAWIPAEGNIPAHFGISDDVGVRAISSIKREQLGFAGDYSNAYDAADIANNTAANTYTAITRNDIWMDVLAKLLGTHMTASLNSEDKYKNATITSEDMETLIAMYEEFVLAHKQEAEAIALQLNLELFAAYGGDTTKYTPFSQTDILAINQNSDSRIKSNGDFSFDVLDNNNVTKTIKITNLKAFLKDYKQLNEDLTTLNTIHERKDYRWTASGLYKVVERLMDVNKCLIKKRDENSYQTIKQLMDGFGSNPLSALGYMGASCDIVITNGVLYNLEQRVGSSVNIQGMTVTAKMYVNTMNLGEQTANITAYVTTSATKPSDFNQDQIYTGTLNTGADSSSGDAVAEDTYALAVDLWVRTNAMGSYLTLEGNVLLGEAYEVPVTTEDANGNQVPLYKLNKIVTDEETGESYTNTLDLYKKEADGTVTWYAAVSHREVTAEELGDGEPVAQVEEKRDVIGYEGENRVWDKSDKSYITTDSTTQGVGSCYVYYADSPEDQARSLELLKYMSVAFVDRDGALLATASMDTENYYGDSGRFVVPLKVNDDGIPIKSTDESIESGVAYAITQLQQNEPTRITAIVYLDGRELGNDDVLSAADIQGQLNIQFSNNAEVIPINNEKLEYETRTVSATVDNTSFEYDTHVGDMISIVTVNVDGDEPTNVRAFFQRKINATQGSREDEMVFTQNGAGGWVSSYTFKAPGVYVLRSVYLDGVEYVLKEQPEVTITGFTVQSLTCDQLTGEGRHLDILTAASSSSLDLKLKFASDDVDKMPAKVQGRFIRTEDGSAVNVDFTYNATSTLWSGKATFLNSGDYTMQYLVLDGEYVELEEAMWLTANVKLGMKTAVYTTDITSFKFKPDEMVENGTDELHMQVKIMDNGDKELVGQQNVKLTYRLRNSSSTIDVNLTWNAVSRYYEGDLQALAAGPGIWEFDKVTVGESNTITNASTYPVFQMLAPEPPSFANIGGTGMQYRPSGNAELQVSLKYSATATVVAVFRDASGNHYPVQGTAGSTANNVTTWNFAVPTNRSGDYSGKQDGYWTLETVYLWNYYKTNGDYVEWAKDEGGNLKGGLSVTNDGSLVSNPDRDDANAMVIDVKSANGGSDYTVKVVQTITVTFAQNQSKDFGKDASGTVTGTFMQTYEGANGINGVYATAKDFEGPVAGAQDITIVYEYVGDAKDKGGYEGGDATAKEEMFTLTLKQDASDKTKFVQSGSQTLQFAGTYKPTVVKFTFMPDNQLYTVEYKEDKVPANVPTFAVWSKAPTVTVSGVTPTTANIPTKIKYSASRWGVSYTLSENKTNSVDASNNTVTAYAQATTENVGTGDASFVLPTVKFNVQGVDSASTVKFTIPKGDASKAKEVSKTGNGETTAITLGNTAVAYEKNMYVMTYSCYHYKGHGSNISIDSITIVRNGVQYTVKLAKPIKIINPTSNTTS